MLPCFLKNTSARLLGGVCLGVLLLCAWKASRADGQEAGGPWPVIELLPGARLTWQAEAGARYRIEKSTTLGSESPGGWRAAAFVETNGAAGVWLDPEPAEERAFYRVSRVQAEVFSIEPPLLSSRGGEVWIRGASLPPGASLRLEIEGAAEAVSVPLVADGSGGVWVARINRDFTPGAAVIISAIEDAPGRTLVPMNQPLEITETGLASDGPPALPPAAPVLDSTKPVPGVGIVVKSNKNIALWGDRIVPGGDESYNPWEMDDSLEGTVLNLLYKGGGKSGDNPLFEGTGANSNRITPGPNYHAINTKGTGANNNRITPGPNYHAIKTKGTGAEANRILPAGSGLPGEVAFHLVDLALDCPAGPPLAWVSTYRSQRVVLSGHSGGWDFSYNVSVEPIPASGGATAPRVRVHDGAGRADVFHRQPDGSYRADGLFREGRFDGGTFTLTFADTGKWVFRPLDGSPAAGKIAAITDRNGVSLTCDYDAATGLLSTVSDAFGRSLTVAWANDRISSVTAEKGGAPLLQVRYTYSGADALRTAVSAPSVPGTPPVAGPLTFTYASGSPDPRLDGLLTSITDGAGRLYEAFDYEISPLTGEACCRTHDRHSGGHVTVLKMSMAEVMVGSGTARALSRYAIHENDELGRVTETLYDARHRPLRIREYTGFATPGAPVDATNLPAAATKLRTTDPDFYETAIAYNADSCPVSVTHPDGSREEAVYEREMRKDAPARERGNARTLTLRSPGGEARTVSMTYLPGFGTAESARLMGLMSERRGIWSVARPGNPIGGLTIKGGRNPGGFAGVVSAAANGIGGMAAKPGGMTSSSYAAGRAGGRGAWIDDWETPVARSRHGSILLFDDTAGREKLRQTQGSTFGEKVAIESPRDSASGLPTGRRQHKPIIFVTGIVTAHGQVFTCDYDAHGNLTGETSPIPGSGALYEYNTLGQLTAATVLNGPGSSFRTEIAYDPATAFPASVTDDPGGLAITSTFAHDDLGRCVSVTDPLGHDWLFGYNPLGQCVTASSPEIMPGVRITTTATVDAGGRIARVDTAHLAPDGKPVPGNPAYSDFYVHDSRARLTRVAAEERPVDASGVLVPDSLGLENFAVCDITYDAAGQVVRVSNAAGSRGLATQVCDFTYDERGLLHRCIEGGAGTPGAVTTECDYDALGALVREAIVAPGLAAPENLYTYDGFHRLASATDAMGNTATFAYDNQGRVTTSVFGELDDQPGSAGNVLLYRSTGSGGGSYSPPATTDSASSGLPIGAFKVGERCPICGNKNPCEFDCIPRRPDTLFNQNASRSNHSRLSLSFFFDVFTPDDTLTEERFTPGAPAAPALETTVVHHSPAGLPLAVTRNGDTLLTLEYDTAARRKGWDGTVKGGSCVLDPAGNVLSERRIDRTFGDGHEVNQNFTHTFAYDALGRCVQATDGVGNSSSAAYDSLGRCVSLTEPGGLVVRTEYDGGTPTAPFSVRVTADVDGDGVPEVLSSRLVRRGVVLWVEDATARRTTFTYDAQGRLTQVTHPDASFEAISYDAGSGRASGKRMRSGALVTYGHDAQHRLTSISYGSLPPNVQPVPPTTYAYDGAGNIRSVTQGDSTVSFTCDSLGNPLTETSNGQTVARTFDHRGRTSVTYPDGRRFAETRNAFGGLLTVSALDAVGQPVSPPLVTHEYAGHRIWRSTTGNGIVTTRTFRADTAQPPADGDFSFDACVAINIQTPAHEAAHVVQQRNRDQRLIQSTTAYSGEQQPPGRALTFTRDALGRIIGCVTRVRERAGAPVVTSEVSYTLDLEGRRLSATGGANPGKYVLDANGLYTAWPGGPLEWDAEDNLRSFAQAATGPLLIAYDAENRLVSASRPGAPDPLVSYTYDALGRRVSRTAADGADGAPVTIRFGYDSGRVILEQESGGQAVAISDFGMSRLVQLADGQVRYVHETAQHWGDPHENLNGKHIKDWDGKKRAAILITDATGATLRHLAYDDAGAPLLLDAQGMPLPTQTAVGPLRWMVPDAMWEPGLRLYLGAASIYSPDLGTSTSKKVVKFKAGAELSGAVNR